MGKENKDSKNNTTPKLKIVNRVFLGEIKLEDFLQKKVELILKKYQ